MKGAISGLSEEDQLQWNAKQSYIALGVLVTTAATLNIDVTPMEGFDKARYTEVLGLDGYHPAVVAAVGYRSEEDALQHAPKVRKSPQELFEVI
jgi:nitroreductase